MKNIHSIPFFAVIVLFSAILLVGCDSGMSDIADSSDVTLSISARSEGNGGKKTMSSVQIENVEFLVQGIHLHPAAASRRIGQDSVAFRSDPLVIELKNSTIPRALYTSTIPIGTYDRLSFEVDRPTSPATPTRGDVQTFSGLNGQFSIVIDGLFQGAAFTYRSTSLLYSDVFFGDELVIDGLTPGPINITLQIDLDRWFTSTNGSVLNPADDSRANRTAIERTIEDSFRLFRDTNSNGRPD